MERRILLACMLSIGCRGETVDGALADAATASEAASDTATTDSDDAASGPCPPGMVFVAGGKYVWGDSIGLLVDIPDLCVDRKEVTAYEYLLCEKKAACTRIGLDCGATATFDVPGKETQPINCVTFDQAKRYCQTQGKRLPREDEWEYVARGPKEPTNYPWGDAPPDASRACYSVGAPCVVGTHPMDQAGTFDMAGNVAEWTEPRDSMKTAVKGGSYVDTEAARLACIDRVEVDVASQLPTVGIRCVKDP